MTGALLAVGLGKMGLQDIQNQLTIGSSQAPGAWLGYVTGLSALRQQAHPMVPYYFSTTCICVSRAGLQVK